MPIYEFKCNSCGIIFEQLIFHDSMENVLCPRCYGDSEKVFSTFSINVPDEACAKVPKGEQRELCTECKQGGGACPYSA
jgi:putative FmdB family regulatory protein